MTELQLLLGQLSEECHEVGQRAIKAMRFGLDEVQEGQELNNAERIMFEVSDLLAVLHMIRERHPGLPSPSNQQFDDKVAKVTKYLTYSKELGEVQG